MKCIYRNVVSIVVVNVLVWTKNAIFLKSILVFMIVNLKKSFPYVIKSCPQTKINGDIVFLEVKESLSVLKSAGFNVHSIVADNHSTNVSGAAN